MAETLYIIDGHSQMFRAYYAPFRDLSSPTGEPTKATYVFCSMLLRFINDYAPKYLAMAVDGPAEELQRRSLYQDYKIQRKPMPEDLPPQIERILRIVEAMGIPILQARGHEADDILATAARRFADGRDVVFISRDKDLHQLLGPRVRLYDPLKDETLDAGTIEQQAGYRPDEAIEVQALAGDASDNVPGVPGIGPKTAAKLIRRYGSAEAVIEHADELSPKQSQNVRAHSGTIRTAKRLVTLKRDVPIDLDLESMRFGGIRGEAVRPLFAELGFQRLLDQLDKLGVAGSDAVDTGQIAQKAQRTTAEDFDYACIDTKEGLEALAGTLRGVTRIAVDTETTATEPMRATLVGISLAWRPGEAMYLPLAGPMGQRVLELEDVRRLLRPVLGDQNVQKVGQNLKYDLIVLDRAGLPIRGPIFDTMVAAHVLDSTRTTYKLDALAAEYIHHQCVPIEALIGRGQNQLRMDAVPIEAVAPYAAEDADVTLRLADALAERMETQGLGTLFGDLEMPLLPVLAEMEQTGVRVDPEVLKEMEVRLSNEAEALRGRIVAAAGRPFNPDSPKQLGEVLFGDLDLPVGKRTKTGPSTDTSVLEQLAPLHELPALVLDYRKLTKLIGTYLKALADCIHPETRRVHTSFHQVGTATGRLSSSDPNLQNIPVRTEQGRQIRAAFVADPGHWLLSADYSQVELRVLAHLCEDATLTEAFRRDQDIHRTVAAEVFGVPLDQVTPDQRARAKTVNFGIIYGQTAYGLSRTLRIPREDAGQFIRAYRSRFPRIEEFLQSCIRKARADGYVETIFGRRRRIGEIDSRNPQRRALAERLAINSVVQGSAADLIKQAMLNVARRIRAGDRPSRMLLQIHDELVFEVPEDALEAEREMIVAEMAGAIELKVPLKVDVGVGRNWMEAK